MPNCSRLHSCRRASVPMMSEFRNGCRYSRVFDSYAPVWYRVSILVSVQC